MKFFNTKQNSKVCLIILVAFTILATSTVNSLKNPNQKVVQKSQNRKDEYFVDGASSSGETKNITEIAPKNASNSTNNTHVHNPNHTHCKILLTDYDRQYARQDRTVGCTIENRFSCNKTQIKLEHDLVSDVGYVQSINCNCKVQLYYEYKNNITNSATTFIQQGHKRYTQYGYGRNWLDNKVADYYNRVNFTCYPSIGCSL